jgi:predicted ATPase
MRSGTMWKISLTKLEQLPVIDPAALPDATIHNLATAFNTLRETDRDSNSHDEIITTIDTLVHHAIEELQPE